MPDPLQKELIQRLMNDPSNWLMGEVPSPKIGRLPFPNKAGGGSTVPAGIGLSSLFNTLKTRIPEAPKAAEKIDKAFDVYRETIRLLLGGK